MRGFPSWQRKQDIEELLRARRPDAPASLLEGIVRQFERKPGRRVSFTGPARVAVLSAVLLAGLLAVGGVGFAASKIVTDFAFFGGADHNGFFGHGSPHTANFNPAIAQYSTTTTTAAATTTSTTTTTTTASTTTTTAESTTTTASTTTDQSSGEVTAVTPADQSGTVTATPPGSSTGATISWTPTTFGSTPVTVTADPTPTIASGFAIQGNPSGNTVVSIVVKDDHGNVIHTLPAPLEIVIKNPGVKGYVPQVSDDNGKNWRTLAACTGAGQNTIGSGQTDCYFTDASGDFHILTLHLTLFAVISKVNATTSETGRPLAKPDSGKFGDPAFIHTGKPRAHVTTAATLTGDNNVKFGFFVDEQVAAYVQVFLHGKPLQIIAGKSTWRGDPVGGATRTQVHKPVLHIGTVNANFKVHGLARGAAVKVTMIDYDGHKITRTLIVK